MRRALSFPERAERLLIAGLVIGIVLIAQRSYVSLYRVGLVVLVASTLLQMAVGNLPRDASAGRSLLLILLTLAIIAAVFTLGIWLVPVFARMGM